LSAIFEALLDPYGITLNVGRGFDGWASIHNAASKSGGLLGFEDSAAFWMSLMCFSMTFSTL
jgi:hypothetical protein